MSNQTYLIINRELDTPSNFVVHEPSRHLTIVRNSWSSGFEELALDGDSTAVLRFKYWDTNGVKKIVLPKGVIFGLHDLYAVMKHHKGFDLQGDRLLIDPAKVRSI